MKILRAIGGFFVKIGRWIKNTAWIQPLLIVGGIFAIIFSIPYITSWVQSWFQGGNSAVSFYNSYKVTLDGTEKGTSNADKLFDYMLNYDDAKESDKKYYGEKFFVLFVEEDCSSCESNYKAFETLRNSFGEGEFKNSDGVPFKMYTIFADTTNDDSEIIFTKYFFNKYELYFSDVSESLEQSYYYNNKGSSSSYASDVATIGVYPEESDGFKAPTIFLFDPNSSNPVSNQLCVSEALFTIEGKDGDSSNISKARTLYDCWYGKDIFSSEYEAN